MSDPVGMRELAQRLGVKPHTCYAWRQRGALPAPDYASVNDGPAWEWRTVLRWAGDTGRIDPVGPLADEYRRRFRRDPYPKRVRGGQLAGRRPTARSTR